MANNGSQMTYSGNPYPYKHLNFKTMWCKFSPNCTKPPHNCPGAHSQSELSKGVQRSECLQRLIATQNTPLETLHPHPTRSSQVTPSLLVDDIIRFIRDKAIDKKTMECRKCDRTTLRPSPRGSASRPCGTLSPTRFTSSTPACLAS